mmetsp:Transcript_23001/g.19044  ORF Transcript_23001/g.19044 Transcript_23001/m.19044 type:complete len:207 (+) Transcript_23001:1-621(+)
MKYAPKEEGFFQKIGLNGEPDCTFVCIGTKAANWFMPKECLTGYNPLEEDKKEKDPKKRGPGGGGWIHVNKHLQVVKTNEDGSQSLWGNGHIFAVGELEVREVMLKLSNPLDTDETGTNNKNVGLLLVEGGELLVLLEDMTTTTLDETLINMLPLGLGDGTLVDSGSPERLTPLGEETESATGGDHAVVEGNLLSVVGEHRLDVGA